MVDRSTATLMDAVQHYLESLTDGERLAGQAEVQRFIRWYGADRPCSQLRGQEVANYAETLSGSLTDATSRADAVRKFLVFAKKQGYTSTNLGTHLRLRKASSKLATTAGASLGEVQITEDEKAGLEAELESLKSQRPAILEDIQRAMADKDFRENAPLDAARDRQGYVEGRIRVLEQKLARAVVVEDDAGNAKGAVAIGSTVHLRNLGSGAETVYTLVRPGDAAAAQGRISFESPVGRALLNGRTGDEVEVAAPAGTIRFRIERIEM